MREVFCPYCGAQAEWLPDGVAYANGGFGGMVYICQPCKAWVGCARRTDGKPGDVPLGRLADYELRQCRNRAQQLFTPVWKAAMEKRGWGMQHSRRAAYAWLSKETGIPRERCNWGQFDNADAKKAIEFLERFYAAVAARKDGSSDGERPNV